MRCYPILAALAIAAGVISCQKELSNSSPLVAVKSDYSSLEEFFKKNQEDTKAYRLKNGTGGICEGRKGIKYHFPSLAFKNLLSSDSVNIALTEILTPYDMIVNNKPTMSDGKPLLSGGEFLIRASSNGKEIKLDAGKYLRIEVENMNIAPGMSVFNGTVTNNGTVNWTINNNQNNSIRPRDSVGLGTGYDLFCDSLQWINCDKFINEPLIKCSFTPVNCPSTDSTAVFVHLTGRNSVLRLSDFVNNQFQSARLIAAPATIIGICYKNNRFYAAITTVTLFDQLVSTLTFSEVSEAALKEKLKILK
jgi:hypothetical protein